MRAKDVANAGIIRPPLIFLFSLLLGIIVDHQWPLRMSFGVAMQFMSAIMLFGGGIVFVLACREFQLAATPIPGNKPAAAVVGTGVFRISRNPIYLAFSSMHLAAVFWTQSLWLAASLVVALLFINRVVIPREESYMERKFGEEYTEYKKRVRCWL